MSHPGDGRGPDATSVEDTANISTTVENATGQSADLAAQSTDVHSTSASAARRRRDKMVLLLGAITNTTEKLAGILAEAQANDDHLALGYSSWTAYVAADFSGLLTGLGAADRRVAVHALAESGMPTRVIAEVAGISQSTAARDVRVSHDDSPAEAVGAAKTFVLGDGSEMVVSAAALEMADAADGDFEAALTAAREQDDLSEGNVVRLLAPRVIGRDGRSYPQQAPPRTPRRKPLRDAYSRVVDDLRKSVDRLEKLRADDRYPKLREGHPDLDQKVDDLAARLVVADEPVPAMPQPARRGPRSSHADVLSRVANIMQGCELALMEITVLDPSVTSEEAARLRGDLARSLVSLDRMIRLLAAVGDAGLVDGGDR